MDAPPPGRDSEWRVHPVKPQASFKHFEQQRLYFFGGGILHMGQNVRINIERERHAGMAQLFTDHRWGDSRDQ